MIVSFTLLQAQSKKAMFKSLKAKLLVVIHLANSTDVDG